MSIARAQDRLQLPETLRAQLHEFRRKLWGVKTAEAVAAAAFGVVVAFELLFALDRVWDTPAWLRVVLFAAAAAGCANVPVALHRWIWRNRRLDQLARLLSRQHPRIGDRLLGVVELVRSDFEQARSRALCEAAIRQVADEARTWDFRTAVPNPRHRRWAGMVAIPIAVALGLFAFVPAAAGNAWARFLMPWKDVPRYTFAAIERLPERIVVAHGEPFAIAARLNRGALWRPKQGMVQLDQQPPVAARLRDGRYEFALPAQLDPGWLQVHIGDSRQRVRIEPTLRPELTAVVADVALPEYLGLPRAQRKDVRGGAIALVKGSQARFAATASRKLSSAQVDGMRRTPAGATVASSTIEVDGERTMEFRWLDTFGLAGKEPFTLAITGRDDEPPSLSCEDLPRQKVVLDSELLSFQVKAQDDFGVKRIGLEWHGVENPVVKNPAQGERVLAAGGNDKDSLEIGGTFSAKSLGIEPQPIQVRIFAEDYLPGRARVYSSTFTLYVLNAEQHAVWLTEQLSKWHRQALEVRDRELQLHETNKQLRALAEEELDRPETRRRIENQAQAEGANGRRLSGLVLSGEDLVRQAMRNQEFGVGHLEKWAEMLQVLKDIAGNRMPSVADLLKQAAQAPTAIAAAAGNRTRMAGQDRSAGGGKTSEASKAAPKDQPVIPQVVDRESTQQPPKKDDDPGKQAPKKGSTPSLRLPQTSLAGKSKKQEEDPPSPAEEKVDEAVTKQQDLLAEFDKISDELNRILANLEGSTLVKRLKAASRDQYKIAGRISDEVSRTFGKVRLNQDGGPPILLPRRIGPQSTFTVTPDLKDATRKLLTDLAEQESKGSQNVSVIMDDMQVYYERRRFLQFKTVLDEMRKVDVIGSLRQIGDDLPRETGVSIAQCEYWSDTLDRWADDLVDPTACGACPGGKSKSSLPPSVVLEVLQILEGEVNLREETRVAQQARPALAVEDYGRQANTLSGTQKGLHERVEKVTERIRELPDGESEFGRELRLLGQVAGVMNDATGILALPETGGLAIAAETEAIELLLQSHRFNPRGGGGGGSSPGAGGGGTTQDSALALLGGGVNDKEVREDRGVAQATGDSGPSLPEEFRAGLDEYFNRLERRPGVQ